MDATRHAPPQGFCDEAVGPTNRLALLWDDRRRGSGRKRRCRCCRCPSCGRAGIVRLLRRGGIGRSCLTLPWGCKELDRHVPSLDDVAVAAFDAFGKIPFTAFDKACFPLARVTPPI